MNESLTRIDILRLEALAHAVASRSPETTTEEMVERARKFEEHLLRTDATDGKPAYPTTDSASDKKYVCIKVDAGGTIVCCKVSNPMIPEGFLGKREFGFVVEALVWESWYDNN